MKRIIQHWHQLNNKQKFVAGSCGTAVALVLMAIALTTWNSAILIWNATIATAGIFKTTPCIYYRFVDVNPLIAGKTVQLKIGDSTGSDCGMPMFELFPEPWNWSSENTQIIALSQDGTVRGIAPGKFTVQAKQGNKTLLMSGIVYPPDWDVRIQPETATIRAGDRITFNMIAFDSQGNLLPPVTFGFQTPDYQEPIPGSPTKSANPRPLLDRSFHYFGTQPGTFRALRPGTITITGNMADRTRKAKLTIE